MISSHYLMCNVSKGEKYHVKKLVFIDKKLQSSEDMFLTLSKYNILKDSIEEENYTIIKSNKINLEVFLKNINLTCM